MQCRDGYTWGVWGRVSTPPTGVQTQVGGGGGGGRGNFYKNVKKNKSLLKNEGKIVIQEKS